MKHESRIMDKETNLIASKIKSFTDLNAWKEGHKLVLSIYRVTKDFPIEEQFGLINQLRRAVISITSNITEDFLTLAQQTVIINKLINGLIKKSKTIIHDS